MTKRVLAKHLINFEVVTSRWDQLRKEGFPVYDEDVIRLSSFGHEHINMLGRYSFAMPDEVKRGELRPLRALGNP
ncbi:TPA: Tn3 family transposase [Legionella anisa]